MITDLKPYPAMKPSGVELAGRRAGALGSEAAQGGVSAGFSRWVDTGARDREVTCYRDGEIVWVTPADVSQTERLRGSLRRITQEAPEVMLFGSRPGREHRRHISQRPLGTLLWLRRSVGARIKDARPWSSMWKLCTSLSSSQGTESTQGRTGESRNRNYLHGEISTTSAWRGGVEPPTPPRSKPPSSATSTTPTGGSAATSERSSA